MKELFLQAINNKLKIRVTFDATKEGRISRTCIPFDFGPSHKKGSVDHSNKYHMLDLSSPEGSHPLALSVDNVIRIEVLSETFDPVKYLTWAHHWIYKRDWGIKS